MADALLEFLKCSLPDELASLLGEQLHALELGNFLTFFRHPLTQTLLGHASSNEYLNATSANNFPVWTDFITHQLELLLSNRDESEAKEATESSTYRRHHFFLVGLAALLAFLQSNATGPPLSFSVAETLLPQEVSASPSAVDALRRALIQSLSVDGEAAYKLTPNVELLSLAHAILTFPPIVENVNGGRWAKVRVGFVRQRLLSELAPSLQASIYDGLDLVEPEISSSSGHVSTDVRVGLLLERAAIHNHHGLEKRAREEIDRAIQARRFEFALTGLLGKRTKYQENDYSQLVVLAKSADSKAAGTEDEQSPAATENARGARQTQPKKLDLNDDTLLESISFSEKQKNAADIRDEASLPAALTALDPENQPRLEPLDSIILLLLASSITNTTPANGLTREETLSYATRVLEGGSSNWQVYTQALLIRSRIEGYSSRTVERGLLQLQAVVDQVIAETTSSDTPASHLEASTFLPRADESEAAPVDERLRYAFPLCCPTRWELEAELASRWVSLGGLRTALEIYERLEMWAEAALCWAATDREDRAKRMVRRQLFHATNGSEEEADEAEENWEGPERDPHPNDAPRLFCILGDIDKDPAMYERAWEVSNRRYARAQRSLGRLYFSTDNYTKAAYAYSLSLTVNQLNQTTWFALGCALLELAQFERAAESFVRAVQLDDTDAEAWSNLAAALLHTETPPTEEAPSKGTTETTTRADNDEDTLLPPQSKDPQQPKRDALNALKHAARLKHDNARIWDNLLTVAASLSPPAYADVATAQARVIALRGATDGEKCVDENVVDLLVRHITTSGSPPPPPAQQHHDPSSATADPGEHPAGRPGIERTVLRLVDHDVVPLITSSARLWRAVARLALWRGRPGAALEAHEKAWRGVVAQPGWEHGTEQGWTAVVDATVELAGAYESLGPRERTEGLAAGSEEVVARDWKFKARSAVRGVRGRGKESWEGTEGWERLGEVLEGLEGLR